MGSCEKCGPFVGTLYIRCRTIIGTQKWTIILTTAHIDPNSCLSCLLWVGLIVFRLERKYASYIYYDLLFSKQNTMTS